MFASPFVRRRRLGRYCLRRTIEGAFLSVHRVFHFAKLPCCRGRHAKLVDPVLEFDDSQKGKRDAARSGVDARQAIGVAWRTALAPPRLAARTLHSLPPPSLELRRTQPLKLRRRQRAARAAVAQRLQPGVGPSESLTLQLGRRPRRAPRWALGDHTEPLRLRLSSGAPYRRQHSLGLLVMCLIDRIY